MFAVHQQGGYSCVEVFFFRTGQNWGNRAYFPRADRSLEAGRGARRVPGAVLRRQAAAALRLPLARDRGPRAARRGALREERPQGRGLAAAARREEGAGRPRARQCARGARAQARRDAVAAEPARRRSPRRSGSAKPPRRIEVYDNSHIQGTQCGRRDDRRGAGGLSQEPVPQVQHPVGEPHAGRRLRHDARGADAAVQAAAGGSAACSRSAAFTSPCGGGREPRSARSGRGGLRDDLEEIPISRPRCARRPSPCRGEGDGACGASRRRRATSDRKPPTPPGPISC